MKKKFWIPIAGAALAAVLFVPLPSGTYKDGGTREYTALTYKVVDWNRLMGDTVYDQTKFYAFPNNFKDIDTLWESERENVEYSFVGTVIAVDGTFVTVEPEPGERELQRSSTVSFDTGNLANIGVKVGDVVEVFYDGKKEKLDPAEIIAIRWQLSDPLRECAFTERWIDPGVAVKCDDNTYKQIKITKIYSNCFFATPVVPLIECEIKLNGTLSDEWCVGDRVACTYENAYRDKEHNRVEADLLAVEMSDREDRESNELICAKPVIYLYPERETEVSVNLTLDGRLTCTYPVYEDGWTVTAQPDGTLTDAKGQAYNYLYWEGETDAQYDLSKGFCVKGEDTAAFLEEALEKLGLTRREANEFIVYWLPLMEQNPYNIISFQTDVYTEAAKLAVNPTPDTLICVFMAWKESDVYIELPEQELTALERNGFTVVEWGGTEVRSTCHY